MYPLIVTIQWRKKHRNWLGKESRKNNKTKTTSCSPLTTLNLLSTESGRRCFLSSAGVHADLHFVLWA